MEIMNYLAPDVVSLGNHEFDYGLPQLLFLEKMANFPIITANIYIKQYGKRLMKPYLILHVDGFDLMFIGILTEKVLDAVKKDKLVGSFISLEDAAHEVGIITDAYKNDDIDLTVLLTHIGYDSDLELAALLKPEWGVDMIVGGHSHTILQQPGQVNNILIAQAGVGTSQIGRFDITVDDDTNSIVEWKWQLIPIEEGIAEPDMQLKTYIDSFAEVIDRKYNSIICKFTDIMTHPRREIETSMGNLFADALAEVAECDVMLVGSGSIRSKELGPAVTLKDYRACFPFEDYLSRFIIKGAQLKRVFAHIMRPENRNSEGECYQVNGRICAVYNNAAHILISLSFNGSPVDDGQNYTIGLIGYHILNSAAFLNITNDELLANGPSKVVATSVPEVLEEYLKGHQNIGRKVEGRLTYL
jgi:5'-nucleotidase